MGSLTRVEIVQKGRPISYIVAAGAAGSPGACDATISPCALD
jgi:hypothetical protein